MLLDRWRLREDHDRLNKGEIVIGALCMDVIRTDAVIECRRDGKGAARSVLVPLYKLERYEIPVQAKPPARWTAVKGRVPHKTATERMQGIRDGNWDREYDDDRMDAFRYTTFQGMNTGAQAPSGRIHS